MLNREREEEKKKGKKADRRAVRDFRTFRTGFNCIKFGLLSNPPLLEAGGGGWRRWGGGRGETDCIRGERLHKFSSSDSQLRAAVSRLRASNGQNGHFNTFELQIFSDCSESFFFFSSSSSSSSSTPRPPHLKKKKKSPGGASNRQILVAEGAQRLYSKPCAKSPLQV